MPPRDQRIKILQARLESTWLPEEGTLLPPQELFLPDPVVHRHLILEFFMNDLSVHTDISNMLVLRVAVGLPVRESLKPDGTIIT